MRALMQKLRGLIGVGLTWGAGWAAITAVIGIAISIIDPDSIDAGESVPFAMLVVGWVGFVSGVGFGLLLSLAERRKTILALSPLRAAVWGMLGAAALPLLTGMDNSLLLEVCPLGAFFAAATVAVARRAELREAAQPRLLDSPR
ncbi:MAG TPA: hypothetical protein VFX98_18650 [Longimicrobiaceae bacterium]|nr:hypothetical protein [Longimicrobiaceae bacterium]